MCAAALQIGDGVDVLEILKTRELRALEGCVAGVRLVTETMRQVQCRDIEI
jgi:hypothetical protein